MTESEITQIVRYAVKEAISDTLTALGYKDKPKEWITQNKAFRIYGRRRVEKAMTKLDCWYKDGDKQTSRVYVNISKIEKFLKY